MIWRCIQDWWYNRAGHTISYALHLFLSGAVVVAWVKLTGHAPHFGAMIALGLGAFKEAYDECFRGGWDCKDVVMDVIGVAVGVLFTAGWYMVS